ncbi:hypothetical protein LPJ61_006643 [Coemansia biformis]|uniref:Uncharacterized protein n=1 Tax=Coemansia biformis TaxID=1286918 RepID=A0A9W8CP24_9FUNG|nr:hypothetical protein LPJ61_006643 [Coemansia biformis]
MESLSPQDSENAANRIKRSLSTLLQRSSSVLRRGGPGARSPRQPGGGYGGHTRQCSESIPRTFARSSSPTPSLEDRAATAGDIACALAASHFFVSAANTAVSSLVGNSMVHVKVVMDGDTAVVVPMLRTMVFATARERILTKLFQGGVPLVESKSRTLAVRRRDGSMAPVVDNQTWRMAMEVAARAHSQQAKAAGAPPAMIAQPAALPLTTRTVVKLTLHLTSLALP